MTVQELYDVCESRLKIKSAYNGKVLCYNFKPDKHGNIGKREILAVWASIETEDIGFGNYASPIMCAYVEGSEEYKKVIEQYAKK